MADIFSTLFKWGKTITLQGVKYSVISYDETSGVVTLKATNSSRKISMHRSKILEA